MVSPGLSTPPFPLLPIFAVPVGEPQCRAPPGLFVPLPESSLQASCPLPALPGGLLSTGSLHRPGGTVLGPCSVRFTIYSQFYQHKEDRSLGRSQATYLEFVSSFLVFLSILFFLPSPPPSYLGFFPTPFVLSGPPPHITALGFSSPGFSQGWFGLRGAPQGKKESSLPAPKADLPPPEGPHKTWAGHR